jgi:glycosyltransferase involved in cell wall biosynthesis
MAERTALWVSTSTQTRGGIAAYVREMQDTRLWTDWNIRHVVTHRDGSQAAKCGVFAGGTMRFILELIRHRPTVVHLHASTRGSFVRKAVLFWISRPTRTPVVMHMHGSGFQSYYENSPRLLQAIIRATMSRVSAFVALGEVWATRMRMLVPAARILAIPNAVTLGERISQPGIGEAVRVVFLGRIGDHKGAFALLDAWAELAHDARFSAAGKRAATLTMAGDGEVERARDRVTELGIDDTVEVHDWLSESEVAKLLDHAHVLVLPSRNAGQPMAVLEAMARGLCVVATDVGGIPEMIGAGCGVLVPADDTAKLAAALQLVVRDHEFRTERGSAAYQRVKDQFDVAEVSRRLDALYREVTRE